VRYAIITDIHANWHALEAIIEAVKAENTGHPDPVRFWFLGDMIGYGPHPVECLTWLRFRSRIGVRWVPGNHDAWLLSPEGVSEDAKESLARHRDLLAEPVNAGLDEWFRDELLRAIGPMPAMAGGDRNNSEPRSLVREEIDGRTLLFVHASLFTSRRSFYLKGWEPKNLESEFGRIREAVGPDANAVMFCGHAHYPLYARLLPDGQVAVQSIRYYARLPLQPGLSIINPGSVGQPRDGDTRAAYAIFDSAGGGTIEFRRVPYAIDRTIAALEEQKYSRSLRDRLASGNGMADLAGFQSVYRRPTWDLEAWNSPSPGELLEAPDGHWDRRRGDVPAQTG
jgi:diadenosine tetraphosphatase ApaH/serine/threonine PP2A family protein phosphatase